MMKAIVYTEYGPPEVLHLKEVETPTPEDDEVLVQVHAASVNSADATMSKGEPFLARLWSGPLKPKYPILGSDIAGWVEAVGKNVKRLQPGDEVLGDISGCGWGGFAEYVCADANVLARKPARVTFTEAAALPQSGIIALQSTRGHRLLRKVNVF